MWDWDARAEGAWGDEKRVLVVLFAMGVLGATLVSAGAAIPPFQLTEIYAQPGGGFYTILAEVNPPDPGSTVSVSLYKKSGNKWTKVASKELSYQASLGGLGRFYSESDFQLVKRARRCKVVADYTSTSGLANAQDERVFACRWQGFNAATTKDVPVETSDLCLVMTELSGLRCADAARVFGTGTSLAPAVAVAGNTTSRPSLRSGIGDPVDPSTALGQLPPLDDPVADLGGQAVSLMVPSGVTDVTNPLDDEGSASTVAPIGTRLGGGGGGNTGANRSNAKYVADAFCEARTEAGNLDGVSIIWKPSSKISNDYGFRIIERKTQAIAKSGFELYWIAHRVVDISDAPLGRVVDWDPSAIRDYGSSFTWSLGVNNSNFSSSMSWNVPAGRSGGYKVDSNETFAMLRVGSGTTYPETTKSETMLRYVKPHSRKSYYLPCGAYFQKD